MRETPKVNEVWLSQSTGNYFRVDEVDDNQVSVTRLGYVTDIGQSNEQSYRLEKRTPETHCWNLKSFTRDLRRLARKASKFEAWLEQNAAN